MTSVDALPDDAESLKRLLLARDEELAVARAYAATVAAEAASLAGQVSRRSGVDRPSEAADREASARAVRPALRAQFPAARPARAAARGARSLGDGGRAGGRASGRQDHQGCGLHRQRPARKPFPEHLPRERVIVPGPTACPCCGGARLSKLGEDVTETLEVIPRQWKVIQHVREKFSCRDCESINQAPAPFHVVPRGWAGPSLLAMILFEKYSQHQPLNRQAERYAREGVPLSLSTLADQVGTCCTVLRPTP